MAGNDNTAINVAAVSSTIAAISAAIVLARKPVMASNGAPFPQEVTDLIAVIAQGVGSSLSIQEEIINLVNQGMQGQGELITLLREIRQLLLVGGGGGVSGPAYPPNADKTLALWVNCPLAQPNAYRLPFVEIPDTMDLVIMAPATNVRTVYIASSEVQAGQTTQSWPLTPGALVRYRIKNAASQYVGAVQPLDGVYITAEQRG